VRYEELAQPFVVREIPSTWRTPTAGPFTTSGSVRQGYFFPVSSQFAATLAAQFVELGLNVIDVKSNPWRGLRRAGVLINCGRDH
jgi:hypothetical protein